MSGGHLYHLEPLSSHLHRRAALQGSEYHVISKRSIRDMLNQNLMSTHNKGISNLFYKRDPGYKPTYIITLLHLENQHFHCSLFLSFRFLVITKALWISRGGGHTTVLFLFTQSESEQLMPIFLSKFSSPYQVIAFPPPLPSPPLPLRSRQFFANNLEIILRFPTVLHFSLITREDARTRGDPSWSDRDSQE